MNGERAKRRRKELRLSGENVAKALNTTRVTISRWESGASEPDDKKKAALAKLLRTSVAYLMGETDNPNRDTSIPTSTENKQSSTSNIEVPVSYGYWGDVTDKARDVAASGDENAIAYVAQMLNLALSLLYIKSQSKQKVKEPTMAKHVGTEVTNHRWIIGEHNENNLTVATA